MRCGATLLFCILAAQAQAAILCVEADGTGDYPTIQAALDVAGQYDIIHLGDGVYTGPGNRELECYTGGNSIIIRAPGEDPEACIIDGEGYRIVDSGGGQVQFQHICFRNSAGLYLTLGEIRCVDCRFEDCVDGIVTGTEFAGAEIVNCVFERCSGTVLSTWGFSADGCRFEDNTGMLIGGRGSGVVADSEFVNNVGPQMVFFTGWDSNPGNLHFIRCRIIGNTYDRLWNAHDTHLLIEESVVAGNSGVIFRSHAGVNDIDVGHCTFVLNEGPLFSVTDGTLLAAYSGFACSIVAFQTSSPLIALDEWSEPPVFSCDDLYGNAGGDWVGPIADQFGVYGNFSADPMFCDLAEGDYTLYDISPCLPPNNECQTIIGAEFQGCEYATALPVPPARATSLTAYPNPFNPKTCLSITLDAPADISLAIYDLRGQLVATLIDGERRGAGEHLLDWSARGLASGVYLARLRGGGAADETKLILIR